MKHSQERIQRLDFPACGCGQLEKLGVALFIQNFLQYLVIIRSFLRWRWQGASMGHFVFLFGNFPNHSTNHTADHLIAHPSKQQETNKYQTIFGVLVGLACPEAFNVVFSALFNILAKS